MAYTFEINPDEVIGVRKVNGDSIELFMSDESILIIPLIAWERIRHSILASLAERVYAEGRLPSRFAVVVL